MRIDVGHNSQAKVEPRRSVYDRGGAERLGDVQEQADGSFLAHSRQGSVLGVFDSLPAAAGAVWRAAHGQMPPVIAPAGATADKQDERA